MEKIELDAAANLTARLRTILGRLGDDKFAGFYRRIELDVSFVRSLCEDALSATASQTTAGAEPVAWLILDKDGVIETVEVASEGHEPVTPDDAAEGFVAKPLYASPHGPVEAEVTDAMVEAAEAAVYPRHERGFLSKPLIDPIDMRKALEAALSQQRQAIIG